LFANLLALALLVQQHADDVTTLTSSPDLPLEEPGRPVTPFTPFFRRELPSILRALFPRLQLRLGPPRLGPAVSFDDPPLLRKKGLLVAKLGYGLYLGLPQGGLPLPYGEMLVPRLRVAQDRGNAKLPGCKLGLRASFFFLPSTGISLEARAGQGWFAALSLIHRW
jgi:hypothetical protein